MSCGVVCKRGLDLALLWPWCKPAATAPVQPLAWEPPCARGVALKRWTIFKKRKHEREIFMCVIEREHMCKSELEATINMSKNTLYLLLLFFDKLPFSLSRRKIEFSPIQ